MAFARASRGCHSSQGCLSAVSQAHRQRRLAILSTAAAPTPAGSQGSSMRAAASKDAATVSTSTQARPASPATFHHGITYTSYEVNTFTVKFNTSGVRVLVDPWFVGNLTFAEQNWLYKGSKRAIGQHVKVDMEQIASETDVLVLTQGLDDHTHMPTLRVFPKHVPVVANPSAAARIKSLGFQRVHVLDHEQHVDVGEGRLRITATVGALVGPPWSKRQNGLVFRELVNDNDAKPATSLYFESHCDFDAASVAQVGQVDVVVSPIVSSLLGVGPAAYPLTMGDINLVKLLKMLRPKVLVPLLNSHIDHTGPLAALIQDRGSMDTLKTELAKAGLTSVRVEFPAPPGESMAIAL